MARAKPAANSKEADDRVVRSGLARVQVLAEYNRVYLLKGKMQVSKYTVTRSLVAELRDEPGE